jgi:hypothetical protein
MTQRAIVLDANILIRAVLGERVRRLIADHVGEVSFFAPDTAYIEARKYLPALLEKRGVDGAAALTVLDALEVVVHPLDTEVYQPLQAQALARIGERDPNDWPALACAGLRAGVGLSGMDRGCRLLWHRRGHVDHQPREALPGARRLNPGRFQKRHIVIHAGDDCESSGHAGIDGRRVGSTAYRICPPHTCRKISMQRFVNCCARQGRQKQGSDHRCRC